MTKVLFKDAPEGQVVRDQRTGVRFVKRGGKLVREDGVEFEPEVVIDRNGHTKPESVRIGNG